MRHVLIWIIFVLILSLLTGCTTYTKVNTKQLIEFEKRIKSEYKQIGDMRVEFNPAAVNFNYLLKKEISEEEVREIFYKTKEIILDTRFQREVIEEKYFEKYFKKERIYPQMFVRFDFYGDDNYDRMFESGYYKTSDVPNEEVKKLVDGYQQWTYWNYKNDPVKVP